MFQFSAEEMLSEVLGFVFSELFCPGKPEDNEIRSSFCEELECVYGHSVLLYCM
jgi:hypothetical protein